LIMYNYVGLDAWLLGFVGAGFKPALVRGGKGEARPVIAKRRYARDT
jgi:hypothetical protein